MKLRSLGLSVLLSLVVPALGCATEHAEPATIADENDIVAVPQTEVERQSIGNCWLYAHASWIESMHLSATGEAFDSSESYWTYWHWFDQIASGGSTKISTGGNYATANNIIRKYGLVRDVDFLAVDGEGEMSNRQKVALDALNASLESGLLSTTQARRDRSLVRQEMDRAWGLSAEVSQRIDRVFGPTVTRTFAGSADATNTNIVRAKDFQVSYASSPGQPRATRTLEAAMREWRQVSYWGDRRAFLQRVQRAMHDELPVIITWFVDFNAMENGENERRGSFNMTTLGENGPGRQGGHMTVLQDYQAKLSDGTVLAAGVTLDKEDPLDAQLLSRALDRDTKIEFLRVKNSWGNARPDRAFAPGMPGYHDLYLDYLDGPIKRCSTLPDGETDTSNCTMSHTPLSNVVLPPGY